MLPAFVILEIVSLDIITIFNILIIPAIILSLLIFIWYGIKSTKWFENARNKKTKAVMKNEEGAAKAKKIFRIPTGVGILLNTIIIVGFFVLNGMYGGNTATGLGLQVERSDFYYTVTSGTIDKHFDFYLSSTRGNDVVYRAELLNSHNEVLEIWGDFRRSENGQTHSQQTLILSDSFSVLECGETYTVKVIGELDCENNNLEFYWDYNFTHTELAEDFGVSFELLSMYYEYDTDEEYNEILNKYFALNLNSLDRHTMRYSLSILDDENNVIWSSNRSWQWSVHLNKVVGSTSSVASISGNSLNLQRAFIVEDCNEFLTVEQDYTLQIRATIGNHHWYEEHRFTHLPYGAEDEYGE
jgi:hypothetical protein